MKKTNQSKQKNLITAYLNFFGFGKIKISKQIFIVSSIVIILSLLLLLFNIWSTNHIARINQQLSRIYSYRSILADMTHLTSKGKLQADLLRRLTQHDLQLQVKDEILLTTNVKEIEENATDMKSILEELVPSQIPELNEIVSQLSTNLNDWKTNNNSTTLNAIALTLTNYQFFTHELSYELKRIMNAQFNSAESHIQLIRSFNLLLNLSISIFLILAVLPLLYNLKRLFNPVRQAAENSVQRATDAFEYAAQINESIAELKHVLIEITRSIGDVSQGAQDSSIQAEKIIGSIQVTSELVVELGEIANTVYKSLDVNQNNILEKISQVNLLSENVSESLDMINQNADIAAKLAVQVATLEEQMEGINSFLVSMEEITEQTNLLALNASIEAARAEEHGKGFAVVAERIRNLSDETKTFTTQIKNTVSGIKTVAKEVAGALNDIISAVRSSASEVSEVNEEFSNLENVLQSLFSSNKAILQAADLQLGGTTQIQNRSLDILKSVENITAQTEQVSASMEEISASSQEITSQIELIHDKVVKTKHVVEHQLETAKLTKDRTDYI
jgi:methyl-accepting chemotaxis protein